MAGARDVLAQHDKFIDSLISRFDSQIQPLVDDARKRTLKALEKKLSFGDGGIIDKTPANQRALRSIDRMFKKEMKRSTKEFPGGYDAAAGAFSDQFADHLPKFEKVLNDVAAAVDSPYPEVKFTGEDLDLFASQAVSTKEMLLDVVDTAANAAKRQALFSVGGLRFSDLADTLAEQLGKTAAAAKSVADTSVSVFYRTIASQSYAKIESGLAPGAVRFEWAGPKDGLERPFCAALSAKAGSSYTRAQIDEMDNGQGFPVFIACGGYRCRHQWILSLADQKGASS